MGASNDARLLQACARILQDEPKKEGSVWSGALELKELRLKLQQRFAIRVQPAALRKVLEHNQDAVVQLDDFRFVHVSKFDEHVVKQSSEVWEEGGKVQEDQGHGGSDDTAPLYVKRDPARTFKVHKVEASDRTETKSSKPGALLPVVSQSSNAAAQPMTSSAGVLDKRLTAGNMEGTGVGDRKSIHESRGKEGPTMEVPKAQDSQSAPAMGGFPHLVKAPSTQVGGAKGERSATCLAPSLNGHAQRDLPKGVEDPFPRTGPIKREPADSPSQEAQADHNVQHTAADNVESKGIHEELESLKVCQDKIKALLAERQSMEGQIAVKLAALEKGPAHQPDARQLRAYLGQLSAELLDALSRLPGAKEAPNSEAAPSMSQHRAQANGGAPVCDGKQAPGGAGVQRADTVELDDSDTELLVDAEVAKQQWANARKRKRMRETGTSSGASRAKRAQGLRAAEPDPGGPAGGQAAEQQEKAEDTVRSLIQPEQNLVKAEAKAPMLKTGDETQRHVKRAPSMSSISNAGGPACDGGEAPALPPKASQLGRAPSSADPKTAPAPRSLEQEPLAHRGSLRTKPLGQTARESLEVPRNDCLTKVEGSEALSWKSGQKGAPGQLTNAQSGGISEPRDASRPSAGSALGRTAFLRVEGQPLTNQQVQSTKSGEPSGNANGLERKAASKSLQVGREQCDAPAATMPSVVETSNLKQRLGLHFPRKRHGEKPARKRLLTWSGPPIDWNIGSQDEDGCSLLESIFGSQGAARPPLKASNGWTMELRSPAALGGCLEFHSMDGQLHHGHQRKQSSPKSLVEIKGRKR